MQGADLPEGAKGCIGVAGSPAGSLLGNKKIAENADVGNFWQF